jgi:uncharacterized membrane protein YgcG
MHKEKPYIMCTNSNLNESPSHFMVLDAISRGIASIDKISNATKMHTEEVESIVNDLLTQMLIVKIEKRSFILRRKRLELGITYIGVKLLNAKKQELEQKKRRMQQSYDSGDGTQLQSYMEANRMWMPMMLFSGIMDMMFFTSIMSFMGLGINPMENAIMGVDSASGGADHHDDQAANSDDGNQPADHQAEVSGQSDSSTGDSGGYDNSSFDSGGFDGFDGGGGFDSF